MIDIDKLQKVADRAIEIGAEKEQLFSAEEVISVFACLRQAEKDAARYRWLRNCDTKQTWRLVDNGHIVGFGVLDAMIDEAMQCGGEENDHASEESRVDLEGLMFDLGNYKAMLGRAENVLFEAERVLVEYQKNGGIEFDDLIGEIAYYVKYMSKGECSDS